MTSPPTCRAAGVQRIHVLAWRDLDDPDAGGSEVHADELMRRWAAAGLDVVHRTSAAGELPARSERHGYDVIRRGSRYTVFPGAAVRRGARADGPVRRARRGLERRAVVLAGCGTGGRVLTIVHHVHGPMWDQVMPQPLAAMGRALEARIAPPLYRHGATVTPSESTREELLELGFVPDGSRRCPTVSRSASRPAASGRRRRSCSPSAASLR